MDLDADVCDELPFEMVEQVFSFLPVPDLCRLRSVSKESNGLICKREFGATHGHNALRRRDVSSFIVMRCTHGTLIHENTYQSFWRAEHGTLSHENTHQTWCFFDLEARRWYTLKGHHPQNLFSAVAAMDGGLVCRFSKTQAHSGFSIIVFNPIADTLREIPSPPAHVVPEFAELNLVVDSAAQQFKVLLTNHANQKFKVVECPLVSIFDSATNEWRTLSNPPGLFAEAEDIWSESFVMFQGFVYAFFGMINEWPDFKVGLWRCSLVENAWERVNSVEVYDSNFDNVDVDCSIFEEVRISTPRLFVSADRLFMMAWIDHEEPDVPWILKVTEIRGSGMDPRRLFMMSKSDVMDVFGVKCDDNLYEERTLPRIHASGCGNSLLFTSISSGKMVVLDLETLEWQLVPQIPVEWGLVPRIPVKASHGKEVRVFHGKHMNLILPSTLWWQEGQGNVV